MRGSGASQRLGSRISTPVGAEGGIPTPVSPQAFRLAQGPVIPFLFPLSLLEWECLFCACSTIVFWKHLTCLTGSQVESSFLKVNYLTHI